jgi:hypothetical protein
MSKPFDAHDDLERSEILEILKELPEDHRASQRTRKAQTLSRSRTWWTSAKT